ncbi:hypothetical protein [Mycobacteroides abscessus]|uniref:hypothetical protein n=2 Tax=Mycobacteroides abscessus TaxID=36809 RepID=UPI0010424618|nr:hypothetical protein [Mycobacteroides abscessus]
MSLMLLRMGFPLLSVRLWLECGFCVSVALFKALVQYFVGVFGDDAFGFGCGFSELLAVRFPLRFKFV